MLPHRTHCRSCKLPQHCRTNPGHRHVCEAPTPRRPSLRRRLFIPANLTVRKPSLSHFHASKVALPSVDNASSFTAVTSAAQKYDSLLFRCLASLRDE
ncbi:hypothetical protein E2542_SST06452 [Spatholobus suberectus]|nr:hypothetical protein E2542_SST06452 [Spatholobus suberectus]